MVEDAICAVPGCDNTLEDSQIDKNISVCSSCEAAKMHLCESCSKRISAERIREGATLCKKCEMNPNDLEEPATDMMNYDDEYMDGVEENEDDEFLM